MSINSIDTTETKSIDEVEMEVQSEVSSGIEPKSSKKSNKFGKRDGKSINKASKSSNEKKVSINKHPAIKQAHFPSGSGEDFLGVPVTYYIPHSLYYEEKSVAILNKYHPVTLEQLHRYDCYNQHPLCAAFRSIAEAHCLTLAQIECRDRKITNGMICDVGGSVNRHFKNKGRKYVHSCVPAFEAKDLLRQFSLKGANYCRHHWQDCECHKFVCSISVHSLYYLEPEEILDRLLKQTIPVHFAVLHQYPHNKGSLMHGEMSYEKGANGKVKVFAVGNNTPYIHGDMSWLSEGSYTSDKGTLAWEVERKFEDVDVFRFVATEDVLELTRDFEESAAVDDSVYDAIINESSRPNLPMNKKNRAAYLARVIRFSKGREVDVEELVRRADERYMGQGAVLQRPDMKFNWTAEARNKALELETEFGTFGMNILLIVGTVLLTGFLPFPAKLPSFLCTLFFVIARTISSGDIYTDNTPKLLTNLLTLVSVGFLMFVGVNGDSIVANLLNLPPIIMGVAKYASLAISIWRLQRKFKLSLIGGQLYDYCVKDYDIPQKALCKRKTIKLFEPVLEDCEPRMRAYPYVYHPDYVPMIPRNCMHNVSSCIRNKVLSEGPDCIRVPKIPKFFYDMSGPISSELEPLDFESWVSRFATPKEKKLRKEMDELVEGGLRLRAVEDCKETVKMFSSVNDSKLFLKKDFYASAKPPRPIHSSSVILNFIVGRWLVPLGELIAKYLPRNILFPIHGDSVEIGKFAFDRIGLRKFISDFSQFDSTQCSKLLEVIYSVFELLGIPKRVVNFMRLDIFRIKVTNSFGFKYVFAGARASGRSDTLLGNTILSLMVYVDALGEHFEGILVKGDDIVLFLHEGVDANAIVSAIAEFGLIAKFSEVDEYDLEFCSSYFIPCSIGLILVPKPGKILAKTLWCKNTDFDWHKQEEQFVGILKGMKQNFGFLPFLNGLYKSDLYLSKEKHVDGIRQLYNEYTEETVTSTVETIEWMMVKYDLGIDDLLELESELKKPIPIRLQAHAAAAMIEADWGDSSDSELLSTKGIKRTNWLHVCFLALIEELARSLNPFWISLLIGGYESFHTKHIYNFLAHFLLGCIMVDFGFTTALVVHCIHNLLVTAGPRLSIMKNNGKSKKQLLNEIASLKGQIKSRKTNGNGRNGASMREYAMMLSDPCGTNTAEGLFSTSEGILSTLKTTFTPTSTKTNGMILWDPTYSSKLADNHMNCIIVSTAGSSGTPTNTSAAPFGAGATDDLAQGFGLSVGAAPFCATTTVSDARCVGACIRVNYFGRMDASKGQLAVIENLPVEALLDEGSGVVSSVDDLFNVASKVGRFGVDPIEVKFRPNSNSHFFKTERDSPMTRGTAGVSATILTSEALRFGPKMIGFAWRNVTSNSELVFEFYQNIEWRPNTISGFKSKIPKQIHSPGYVEQVLKYLDDNHPGWQSTSFNTAVSVAAGLSRMAMAGSYPRSIRWRN